MSKEIQVKYTKELIKAFRDQGLPSDILGSALLVLIAIDNGETEFLETFDDDMKERRVVILYRELDRRGFIAPREVGENIHYHLTPLGKSLLDKFDFSQKTVFEVVNEAEKEEENWIQEYIQLFPKHLRDNTQTVLTRMREFIKVYKYSKEVILQATRQYLIDQEEKGENYKYTRRSVYFIWKGRGTERISDLASWCEHYLQTGETLDTSDLDIA